jgi:hypothetical protein
MSGAKRISVDEAEWRRLRQAAERLRDVRRDLPGLLEGVRRETRRALDGHVSAIQDRQRAFEATVNQMSTELRDLERDSNRRLDQHAGQMRAALTEATGQLREETMRLVAEQDERLAAERRERRRQFAELRQGLDEVVKDARRAAEVADQWLHGARQLHDTIRDTLPHERFAPGELDSLRGRLSLAERNARDGMAQAAVAGAQEAYAGLSELRASLELRDREWRIAQQAARESLLLLKGMVDGNAMRKGIDSAGQEIDVDLDVDYWTAGKLTALRQEVEALQRRVTDQGSPLGTDELLRIAGEDAPRLERALQDVVQEAGTAQLASQLRVNIADLVVQTLVGNGYEPQGGTYEGEDQRGAFAAKVRHGDGSEIVVLVTPADGDPPGAELRIESFDMATGSEAVRLRRAQALAAQLRENGLAVGEPERAQELPDERVRDIEAIRAVPLGTIRAATGRRGSRAG